ncbi:MAG: SGNH/GDSL hydrolase family protein [Magnetococcus sp. DMHC-1]
MTLIFLETVLRIHDVARNDIIPLELLTTLQVQGGGGGKVAHPFLLYTNGRNFSAHLPMMEPGRKFYAATNADGFRTPNFYPKLPGVVRILLLGDSFMFGYNASQSETVAVRLEEMLRQEFGVGVEVFSLGVPSYATVQYAVLARIYFDYLTPDLVIVAVDQSDLNEDIQRETLWLRDADQAPIRVQDDYFKKASQDYVHIRFDADRNIHLDDNQQKNTSWQTRMRIGSSLYRHYFDLQRQIEALLPQLVSRPHPESMTTVSYDALVDKFGPDLRQVEFPVESGQTKKIRKLHADMLWFPREQSRDHYKKSLHNLRFVQKKAAGLGADLYLSVYPYPWFVSTREALLYQYMTYGTILDFRSNRVFPQIMQEYARELNLPLLDFYPVMADTIRQNPDKKYYGHGDPHFNGDGYLVYARFLFDSVRDAVARRVGQGTGLHP